MAISLRSGKDVIFTVERKNILPPHDHKNVVGTYSQASEEHVNDAIKNLISNKESWSNTPWEKRCDIFLKAADLLSKKYRAKITSGTMIGQSKNIFQAEIDAATAKANKKASGKAKLKELGLDDAEIKALIGA